MKKSLLIFLFTFSAAYFAYGQGDGNAPNYSNSSSLPADAAASSKITSNLVNLFTGQANVSIPIYSYKNNSGLAISVSLEYMGGGVQVGESPTSVGLGWYLSAGGSVTRTVKGLPDDVPTNGYLYASAIPQDWRSNGNKYYHDSLDTQQDMFQYSLPGHSGKFYIGKNGQIVTVPLSKIKIIPAFRTPDAYYPTTLKSFRIITEDGVKYDFEDVDQSSVSIDNSFFATGFFPTPSAYYSIMHPTSWNLTRIVSPFYNDTIKINYDATGGSSYGYKLPAVTFVDNSTGLRKTPATAPGSGYSQFHKVSSIELPDKTTVLFVYDNVIKYTGQGYALSKIEIKDTAFRFGYLLGYDTSYTYYPGGHLHGSATAPVKTMLTSVTPYTSHEKQKGYEFTYIGSFPREGAPGDTLQSKRDHWGFFNGAYNGDSLIPKVLSYSWGADRSPNSEAMTGVLWKFKLPTGGSVGYTYESNDHYPYSQEQQSISIAAATSSSNIVPFNQVYNTKHQLTFLLDKSVSRTGSVPISGAGDLNVFVRNTAGTVTYVSTSISLYDLFYSGVRTLSFSLADGTYKLETALTAGTSISGSFPVNISWENTSDTSINYQPSGGVRVMSVSKENLSGLQEGSYDLYKYVKENGKSSGFLGDIPRYDYQFRETYTSGPSPLDFTVVCSEPLTTAGFVLGAPVGYSRVEIISSSSSGSLGKEVQEFTDLKDMNSNSFPIQFPYTPQDYRAWGLGMPKRISVYDSAGNLVKRTVNTVQYDSVTFSSSDFKSLKMGHSQTNTVGSTSSYTSKTKIFIAEDYPLTSGRVYITSSHDTLYHLNASISTSYQDIVYDTNYNVTKVTTSYDRTRSLVQEQRMYYPYNYSIGGGIGKLRDSSIISLPVSTETWITGDGNPRITSLMATSFRQIGNGDIKPDTIYSFESRKPVLQATIGTFDASKLNRNTTYIKPQTYFTDYDTHGNLSEMKSLVSGLSNSVITDYDQQYAIAKVSNAVQSDIAFTSFESAGSGNWTIGSSTRDLNDKLTGKKSYNLSNGNVSKSGLSTGQNYLLTFWAKAGASVTVNSGSSGSAISSQQGWNFYSVALSGISSVTISGSGLIDEVRLHPKDANMATYAFEPLIGVISSTDANNTVVYNEYDNLNRLKLIRDKDKYIIKRFDFSDTTMVINTAPNWVGFDKVCSLSYPGSVDSVYRDTNIFSDSSGIVKHIYLGYMDCSCPDISSNPSYAVINGNCEQGTWTVTSSVRIRVDGVWMWKCTYQYCFSDGSMSSYSEILILSYSCPITCF